MANRLKMAEVQAILALFERGWSRRKIARELGVDRETVNRHVRLAAAAGPLAAGPLAAGPLAAGPSATGPAGPVSAALSPEPAAGCVPNPANVHLGSGGLDPPEAPPNPAIPHTSIPDLGSATVPALVLKAPPTGRSSGCAPFAALIQAKLDQGLSVQRIFQDLVADHGFAQSYWSVRRWARRLRPAAEAPFRRLEKAPGEEAQVDFGKGAWLLGEDGKRTRPHVFRIVLSHSRKGYSEAVPRQTTDAFIACLENAFQAFGGVPKTLVIDNLKAAVTKADWFDPELNPKLEAFARHYGTVILPTKPYTPRHKGKVERGVDYVQDNALKGRTFASLAEQNLFLREWEETVADPRSHGTTRRPVGKVFQEVERPALLPLPAERFPNFKEAQRTVHRDGHVEVERAYYSVPPEHVGRTVWARWDGRLVRIFNQRFELLATHVRHRPGSFSTDDDHLLAQKKSKVETGAKALLAQVQRLGTHIGAWAQAMLVDRGLAGIRPLLGLLSLAKRHPPARLDEVCQAAHEHGAYRLKALRHLLQRREEAEPRQLELPFTESHPLIRPLSEYGALLRPSAGHRASEPSFQETR